MIGSSSNGGNACDGSPFIVSFPLGGKPRFDGPIEACANIGHDVFKAKIMFSADNMLGHGREQWSWTPAGGLKGLGVAASVPKRNQAGRS